MTVEEALAECRRRWGERAAVCNGDDGPGRCLVGVFERGTFRPKGAGASWSKALEAVRGDNVQVLGRRSFGSYGPAGEAVLAAG
jgi:hypothetical protein